MKALFGSATVLALQGRGEALAAIWVRWRGRLGVFFAGQLAVQLLAFVTGLLVLRWMTEDEYAKTGVVLGFQALLSSFVDLGIGGSLVSLIGARGHQREVVGAYSAAARWWRRWLIALIAPLGGIAFVAITLRQGWSLQETGLLYACLVVTLYFTGVAAWASAPLLVHQRLSSLYLVSNAGALVRLAGCAGLYYTGHLSALTVTVLGALVSMGTAWLYRRAAARFVAEPARSSPTVRREIGRYIAPLVPIALFFALQAQVGTLLISWFGQSQSIAEVTALGRLAQLFAFVTALYSMLVVPHFAGLHRDRLAQRYTLAACATLLFAALVGACAFAVPQPLLWLLGPRYAHLGNEIGWLMLGSALAFAGSALWSIHAARKWVFWWGTAVYIGGVLTAQALFVSLFDTSTTLHVLYMGVATNAAALMAQGLVAWLGFRLESSQAQAGRRSALPLPVVDIV